MLKKKERLTKQAFDRSFSVGRRTHGPNLLVIHDPQGPFHGAVAVGKKVHKKAVDRNRLRRRLYAILYRFHKEHNTPGTYILVAKPGIQNVPRTDLAAMVMETLKKTSKRGTPTI